MISSPLPVLPNIRYCCNFRVGLLNDYSCKVKNIKVTCVFMIKVDIKSLFLHKIMYKTITSDVTENKHSRINVWAICDLSPI